jgi:Region found in RelA / SpoT proteins
VNKSFALNKKAQHLAAELLKQAVKNEHNITADLQNIAREISAEMVGLENKFKTEVSLIRKLTDTANINSKKLQEVAETINDVLRYSFILPIETYKNDFQKAINLLESAGYTIPKNRIWNAWKYIGNKRDKGYRGINITIISSQRQKFELQFHTAESYLLKTETHDLYKELRSSAVSEEREAKLIYLMKEVASNVKRPEGV